MANCVGRARLGDETADDLRVGGVAGGKHLDRGPAPDARVDGQIDLSHPPFSDEALDLVVAYARPYHPGVRIIIGVSVTRNDHRPALGPSRQGAPIAHGWGAARPRATEITKRAPATRRYRENTSDFSALSYYR